MNGKGEGRHNSRWVRVARYDEVRERQPLTVQVDGHTLVLFAQGEQVFAVDNRCPHMGFPLDRGTVQDGILTCHWHHARFDLASGGTFDLWADDVPSFPVEMRDGEVWVDVSPRRDLEAHHRERLHLGLERSLSLVIAKSVIHLLEEGSDPVEPFRIGVRFGATYRRDGWGQGLTILTCMMNLLPYLAETDRSRALYHGLTAVAQDTAGSPPRFTVHPLPQQPSDLSLLKRWFRRFVEVRDAEGAERCIVTAIRAGADHRQMADMLFSAATDHRYISTGHVLDFTNKAFEALDITGWQDAEMVLTSLAAGYAAASRMEESNAWRHPIDLVALLSEAFEDLPDALAEGRERRGTWRGREDLIQVLLGDDPHAIVASLLDALRRGATETEVAGTVAYAAARRIAHFHISNEFGDWDTALHTFTFANAVHQGLRRVNSPELLRGVFDAAMSIYLDRFLNVPLTRLPSRNGSTKNPPQLLRDLDNLLDRQQQVNEAGDLVARYLYAGGEVGPLLAHLGRLLLREDRDFHTIQMLEAAFRQFDLIEDAEAKVHTLVAAARYLAAHSPTMRAQGQTFRIAQRLHRGERLFEEEAEV